MSSSGSVSRRSALPALAPLVLAAAVTLGLALSARGGDPVLLSAGTREVRLDAGALEGALLKSREPRPEGPGSPARSSRCTSSGRRALGNPWRCQVSYVSGARIVYDVRVLPSGTFFGVSTDGDALVEGRVPPLGA